MDERKLEKGTQKDHHGSSNRKKQNCQQESEFDANLEIFKIFSWLPGKSIFRFMLTCKACNEFPSDMLFVKQQYMHMGLKNDSAFFIQPRWSPTGYHKLEFHVNPSEEASSGLPNQSLKFLKSTTRVLASSNGLLCCKYKKRNELIICNPTTQSWKPIEVPMSLENFDLYFNLVFQCSIKEPSEFPCDFLLMMIKRPEEWSKNATCKVYLLQAIGNWEEIGEIHLGPRRLYSQYAFCYNGNVHLLLNCFSSSIDQDNPFYWPHILAYDFKKGTQRFIQIPENARGGLANQNCQMCIFEWGKGESICLVQLAEGDFTIWTLSDHSSSPWTKVLKICTQDIGIIKSYDVAGFKIVNGESLLVATKEKVYRYYLKGDFDRKAEKICQHNCSDRVSFHSYSSTLHPCGDGAMPIPK